MTSRTVRRGTAFVALITGFFVIEHFAKQRIDRWRYPWRYDTGGRPPLVGTWVGPLATTSGLRSGVLLEMRLVPNRPTGGRRSRGFFRSPYSHVAATARTCDARGELTFPGHAEVQAKDGSSFYVAVPAPDSVKLPDGYILDAIEGQWDGGNTIRVQPILHWRQGRGRHARQNDPNLQVRGMTMQRGTEQDYRALCGRLAGR